MESKIIKNREKLMITLPQTVSNHIQVGEGDNVKFILEENNRVTIEKQTSVHSEVVDEENFDKDFLQGLKQLLNKYDETLQNLAKR